MTDRIAHIVDGLDLGRQQIAIAAGLGCSQPYVARIAAVRAFLLGERPSLPNAATLASMQRVRDLLGEDVDPDRARAVDQHAVDMAAERARRKAERRAR